MYIYHRNLRDSQPYITLSSFILKKKKGKKKKKKMAASNGSNKFMFISHFLILLILALFFVPSDGRKVPSMEALSAGWGLAKSMFEFVKNLVSPDKDGKK